MTAGGPRSEACLLLLAALLLACGMGAIESGGAALEAGGEGGRSSPTGGATCVEATLLWSEGFETGDYRRWTSEDYAADWGNDCQDNGFSTRRAHTGRFSHRSEITCADPGEGTVHRGYGGLQFDGDTVRRSYTNSGTGIDAPHGVVNIYWSWLETETTFEEGSWFSFWTINSACDWSDPVLTLGLEDASNRLAAAHYWHGEGGERRYAEDASSFPLGEWVRTTIYVNYHENEMHVWQNGESVSHVTFDRSATTICQWHWGAYASGDNDDVVLYEDDIRIWKLHEEWKDFGAEPRFGEGVPVCE